ncbi:MAG: DNA translocase FtsK 4TM domain-containing protein [Flavobacteriales bacterium]|nr:DNA translocase FtsK 4TM domain-containing protein [Flavobacteriales bacterium]
MGEKSNDKKGKKGLLQKINPLPGIVSIIQDEKFKRVFGLLLILFSFYLLIAFVSFLFTWQTDQDLMYGSWKELLLDPEIIVSNWLGKLGAMTSQIFINNWFGVASFLFVFLFFLYGVKILTGISLLPLVKTTKNTLFAMIWLSASISYFIDTNYLFAGGATGYYMNEWLVLTIGNVGAFLFLGFVFIVYLIVAYNFSFKAAFKFIAKALLYILPKNRKSSTEEESGMDLSNINPLKIEEESVEEVDLFYPDEIKADRNAQEVPLSEGQELELDTAIPESEKKKEVEELEIEVPTTATKSATKVEGDLDMDVEIADSKEEILSDSEVNRKLKDFGEYDPTLDLAKYKMPGIDLLENHGDGEIQVDREELEANKIRIVDTLRNYKIEIEKIKATIGPTVTLYEIVPAAGVRISKIKNLEDDIALSLSALGIRIIAPIPGKGTIGIEVPNQKAGVVSMKAVIASERFQNSDMELPLALGKTISNETFVTDLAKMPHLLMAGATGQGKSVGLNAILVSILYKKHPSQVKFVLVDPKKVELTLFNKIERHYLAKLPDDGEAIITDTSKVVATLNSLCIEMDERYDLLKDAHCRNIKEYNKKFIQRKLNPENGHKYMPYIIVVVDEFADLIMTAGKEVETPIARIAQLARAIGIHLIIATQRPSVNIITGVIKANFPSRIAFRVSSKIDSRTILDAGGADQLIGRGDLLFSNGNDLIRVQCAFVDTPEVEAITEFIGNQNGYPDAFFLPEFVGDTDGGSGNMDDMERDALFEDAARTIVQNQQGSASLLQRRLKLGYNRAGRIIDQLEHAGIIGPFKGSKAREVLIPDEVSLEQFLNNDN